MMHTRRPPLLLASVGLCAALLAPAAPAHAADVFVDLNPSTVEAGYMVGIQASCPSDTAPATVESEAFGTVTAHPQHDLLTATATVSDTARARGYRVRLVCADGHEATTTLYVVTGIRPKLGPATGFGGTAGGDPLARWLVVGGLAMVAAGVLLGRWTRRQA